MADRLCLQAATARTAQLAELMGDMVEGRASTALSAAAQLTRLDVLLKGPACAACCPVNELAGLHTCKWTLCHKSGACLL